MTCRPLTDRHRHFPAEGRQSRQGNHLKGGVWPLCLLFHNITPQWIDVQGESLARGPKTIVYKNYVIEIMTWKFIYTYRERCKTGPAHNRCWNWSPFTSKHTWMRFSKFWNTFPKVSTLTAWISWRIASLSCSIVRGVFLYTLSFNRPQRKKSTGVRSASPCL